MLMKLPRDFHPLNPECVAFEAGKIMLRRLEQLIAERKNFAFETTLSGMAYLKFLKLAKEADHTIILFFVHLYSPELAKERVVNRVSKGGHSIPPDVIERRYFKGMQNFSKYVPLVDDWYVYDNSGTEYVLVAKSVSGKQKLLTLIYTTGLSAMKTIKKTEDLSDKIKVALDKAVKKVIAEEKARNGYLPVAGKDGKVKKIPAKDL